jgi:hypothetical protein
MRALTAIPLLFALPSFAILQYVAFPHLLIPLKSGNPNTAFGTQFTGIVATGAYSEVSFDVPANVPSAICRINFHINTSPIKHAPWSLSGSSNYFFNVTRLEPTMNQYTDTWNSHPMEAEYVGTVHLGKDGSTSMEAGWFDCPKGQVAQFLLFPTEGKNFYLSWYELNYSWADGGPHGITLEMHT